MKQADWLSGKDLTRMVAYLTRGNASPNVAGGQGWRTSERKLHLWVEACREVADPGTAFSNLMPLHVRVEDWSRPHDSWLKECPIATRVALLHDIIGNPFVQQFLPLDTGDYIAKGRNPRWGFRPRCSWLTPTVVLLAQVAYDQPVKTCRTCDGRPKQTRFHGPGATNPYTWECNGCYGTGRRESGVIDTSYLTVLSDALEEAGCPAHKGIEGCNKCGGTGAAHDDGPMWDKGPRCSTCKGKGTLPIPHPFLAHLRSPGPHVRGCWVLDLLLGKE